MKKALTPCLIIALVVLWSTPVCAQSTWFVDCGVSGPGTGTYADPFNSIQSGLDACAPGDLAEVANGSCVESLRWPDTDGISLYSASHNPTACFLDGSSGYVTIQVGEMGVSGPGSLSIEGIGIVGSSTASGVYINSVSQESPVHAVIDNVLIEGVWAPGIFANGEGVHVTVTNSTIRETVGAYGVGGIYYMGSGALSLRNCTIADNRLDEGGVLTSGVRVDGGGAPVAVTIRESRIYGNEGVGIMLAPAPDHPCEVDIGLNEIHGNQTAFTGVGDLAGGIAVMGHELTGAIRENVIYDHVRETTGVAVYISGGNDLYLDQNFFFNNGCTAPETGQFPACGGVVLDEMIDTLMERIYVTNNIVATNGPHGIFARTEGTGGPIFVTNNTVVDNQVVGIEEEAGGSSEVTVTNCIVGDWDSASGATDLVPTPGMEFTVNYSDVEDPIPPAADGGTNVSANPNFMDWDGTDNTPGTTDDDYHVQASSPCIDLGTNSGPGIPSTDIDGDARILDGDGDSTVVVDMGADEFVYASPPYSATANAEAAAYGAETLTGSGISNQLSLLLIPVAAVILLRLIRRKK